MPESILDWGIGVVISIQSWGDWLITPMNAFTYLGFQEFYLVLLPILFWCVDTVLGIRIAMYFLLNMGLNLILKVLIHDPRPYMYDPRVRLLTRGEWTFGIPSGHSQIAVAIWGGLATQLRKRWMWALALFLIFFIGFSRIFLGVHFPTDVFVGWGIGIVFLILLIWLEKPVLNWYQNQKEIYQYAYIGVVALLIILGGVLTVNFVDSTFTVPAEWVANVLEKTPDIEFEPLNYKDYVSTGATFFGMMAGATFLMNRQGFDASGTWGQKGLRLLIGLVGIIVIWAGADEVFSMIAEDESLLGYILRFIRYGLVGSWASALAPLLFIRLKIASPSKP
jgi:membrane-associated phospholipid phosphatase